MSWQRFGTTSEKLGRRPACRALDEARDRLDVPLLPGAVGDAVEAKERDAREERGRVRSPRARPLVALDVRAPGQSGLPDRVGKAGAAYAARHAVVADSMRRSGDEREVVRQAGMSDRAVIAQQRIPRGEAIEGRRTAVAEHRVARAVLEHDDDHMGEPRHGAPGHRRRKADGRRRRCGVDCDHERRRGEHDGAEENSAARCDRDQNSLLRPTMLGRPLEGTAVLVLRGGERGQHEIPLAGGIRVDQLSTKRRGEDLNLRSACTDNGFRDRRIRPLCHPSSRGSVPSPPGAITALRRGGDEGPGR